MSYPILYTPTETKFDTNGIGTLSDTIRCKVTEERNGMYEMEMDYPVSGVHFSDIALRSLITAKPNPYVDVQPFRVYRITRPLNGVVTIYGQHISYDLAGVVVSPFTVDGIQNAFVKLKAQSIPEHSFSFWTDKTTAGNMTVSKPISLRNLLGGVEGSILDVYGGGEYEFDAYEVKLYQNRGADHGVSIRYGKNLTDINQEENCASVYTGVYPYWADSEGNLVELSGNKIVNAEGTYNFSRIMPLDLSSDFEEAPTEDQLRSRAKSYVDSNKIGVPSVSLEVSFVQLEQTEEYRNLALFERVGLCDTVTVVFPEMGVEATAEVVKTEYNTLLERYESVTIGDAKTSLADTIVEQSRETEKKLDDTKTQLQQAVDRATAGITGNKGGYVYLHDSNDDKYPDELLIVDQPSIADSTHVWRWNKEGLGYSGTGYNGPYGTAITADGHIVANYVNAGELNANYIKGGTLKLGGEGNGNGRLEVYNAANSIIGYWDSTGISANVGTFSGTLNAATGSFAGELKAATGTFAGSLSAATGTFAGELKAATGTFAGTLSANNIKGGTLTLGGANNENGVMILKNASNQDVARFDNTGANIYSGSLKIGSNFEVTSGGSLTANNATLTGAVSTENGYIKAILSAGQLQLQYADSYNGYLRASAIGYLSGISFDVEPMASFVALRASDTDGSSNFPPRVVYSRSGASTGSYTWGTNSFNLYCDLDMHGYHIRNAADYAEPEPPAGTSIKIPFVQIVSVDDSGATTSFSDDCYLEFQNGILVGARCHG